MPRRTTSLGRVPLMSRASKAMRPRLRDAEDPDGAVGDLQIQGHDAQDLNERDGGQREEDAAQAERRQADRESKNARDHRRHRDLEQHQRDWIEPGAGGRTAAIGTGGGLN